MGRNAWIVVAAVVLLIIAAACALLAFLPSGQTYGWGMMGGPWMSGGWGMMGMMLIWPVLLLVVVVMCVVGAVWFAQSASRGGSPSGNTQARGETPLDILKRRYAGGEITREQFEDMRRGLES